MKEAEAMKEVLEAMASSEAFIDAPANKGLKMLHDVAFAVCVAYDDDGEYGYGPARRYQFADGSVLVDDGRGYFCEE